jgi:hypothetical protein
MDRLSLAAPAENVAGPAEADSAADPAWWASPDTDLSCSIPAYSESHLTHLLSGLLRSRAYRSEPSRNSLRSDKTAFLRIVAPLPGTIDSRVEDLERLLT